jgi:hypothetical protein
MAITIRTTKGRRRERSDETQGPVILVNKRRQKTADSREQNGRAETKTLNKRTDAHPGTACFGTQGPEVRILSLRPRIPLVSPRFGHFSAGSVCSDEHKLHRPNTDMHQIDTDNAQR